MITLRVKTLDSVDHPFELDDEATVYNLKEKIKEAMGIEIGQQRLIFCGRVLQDDMRLSVCGVDGKVLHMVQRAPPSVAAREAIREARQQEMENIAFNQAQFNTNPMITPLHLHHITPQQIRRLLTMAATAHGLDADDQSGLNLSPTASRLNFLRKLIQEIRELIETIKDNESNEPPNYPTEDPPQPSGAIAEASRSAGNADVIFQTSQTPLIYQIEPASGSTRQSRGRCIRAMRPTYHTPPHDFGALLRQLHDLEAEFAPFREMYITTLREANDTSIQLDERALQRRQLTAEMSAEVFHSFAHAYHLVSDIGILMTHGHSRLTSEALMRHPSPVQAHVNVIQTTVTRRPRDSGASTSGQSSIAGPSQPSAPPAGRNQPIVNINVQPDPFTYQVEIETRVPLTVNPDNQSQNQNINQDEPANRQVMLDFENLFRGLNQPGTIGGVEVVMSMEEVPQAEVPASPQVIDGAALQQMFGSQVYLAQMPWGGQPTADFLQNIVSSVIRQGMPGMDSVMTEQHPNQNQAAASQNQDRANQSGADPTPAQIQTETSGDQQNQTSSQTETSGQAVATASQPGQTQAVPSQAQGGQETGSSGSQPSQQASGSGQGVTTTVITGPTTNQAVTINDLMYDRFLGCDSLHARRQLERRRDETARNGGPFLRDNNLSRIQNLVETLFERFAQDTINEETLVIAALVWLRESTAFSRGRTLIPEELLVLRRRLQVHMWEIIQGEYEENTHEQLTDVLFERYAGFIRRMPLITPLRPSIDVVQSMRNVIVRFLNEAMLVLFMENTEVSCRRFRIVFPRMFYELCGVISYFCYEGVEGLRRIYRTFIADLIQNIDEPVRDLLYSLAIEILNTAIIRIQTNKLHCSQFLVTRENVPSTSIHSTSEDAGSMDIADADLQGSEPMQTSPMSIAESAELEEEMNFYNCPTPPIHELNEMRAAGIIPTVISVLSSNMSRTPSSSAPVAPIVQTFTTVPSASLYQPPTIVQSGPIVPTVSIVPGSIRTVPYNDPVVPASPIVSATSVIVSAPTMATVPEPPPVSSAPDSPVILSPYSPLSPAGEENATSTVTSASGLGGSRGRNGMTELMNQRNLDLHDFYPRNVTMTSIQPLCLVVFEDEEHDHSSNNSSEFSAPEMETAPVSAQSSGSGVVRRPSIVSTASSARPGRSSDTHDGQYNAPEMETAPVSAQSSGSGVVRRQFIASATASTSRATHDFEPEEGRDNTSASSTSSRPGPSHDSRHTVTSTSTSAYSGRSQDSQHGSRGRRAHRGSHSASTSTSPYNRSQDSQHGYRGRRVQRGHSASSTSTSSYESRSQDSQHGLGGRRPHRGSHSSSPYSHLSYPGARRAHRGYIPPPRSGRIPVLDRYNEVRPVSYAGPRRVPRRDIYLNGYNLGIGRGNYYSNPLANTLAARAERHLVIGNSYGSISYSSDVQNRPAPRGAGSVRQQTRGRDQARPNQENNPGSSSSADESSNVRFVPPAHIAQHWGEDWVLTFTRDIQQQNDSSEPHSDAYLSGMPPKKRRCVRQSRPPTTLDGLISGSLSQVAPQLTPTVELRLAFRRQLRVVTSARAAASSDYDPNRYVSTERFLKQNRSNTQKSTKKTSCLK